MRCARRRSIYFIALAALVTITALTAAVLGLYIAVIQRIDRIFLGSCGHLPAAPLAFPIDRPAGQAVGEYVVTLLAQLAPFAAATYNMYCSSGTAWIPAQTKMTRRLPHKAGFVLAHGPALLIAFRGTFNFADTLTDLNTRGVTVPWLPAEMRLHRGFSTRYAQVRAIVHDSVRVTQPSAVFVTGHSLGAALSMLCLSDLARNTSVRQLCGALYACPKVGNRAFATGAFSGAMDRMAVGIVRNQMDAVPLMPPGLEQPYVHVDGGSSADGSGGACYHSFYHDDGSWGRNHRLSLYMAQIATLAPTPDCAPAVGRE